MTVFEGCRGTAGWLWQASWQLAIIVATAAVAGRAIRSARRKGELLHAGLVLGLASVVMAGMTPHYVIAADVPSWTPFIERASEGAAPAATCGAAVLTARPLALLPTLMVAVWLGGVVRCSWQIIRGWGFAWRLVRASEPFSNSHLDGLRASLATRRRPDVRVLAGATSAFCWQFHRPIVVLPAAAVKLDPGDLEMVLRHEFAHLRSGDPARLLIERVIAAVFWFHPLVLWSGRCAQRHREFACDEDALGPHGSVERYAQGLLRAAEQSALASPPAAWFGGRGSELAARISRLLQRRSSFGQAGSPSKEPARLASLGFRLAIVAVAVSCSIVRLGADESRRAATAWTPWPQSGARLLGALGIPVVDYDAQRAAHDAREQSAEHRRAHRRFARGRGSISGCPCRPAHRQACALRMGAEKHALTRH